MIRNILNWLLSFFQQKKEAKKIVDKIDELEENLEEIEDEEHSTDDIVDHFND